MISLPKTVKFRGLAGGSLKIKKELHARLHFGQHGNRLLRGIHSITRKFVSMRRFKKNLKEKVNFMNDS